MGADWVLDIESNVYSKIRSRTISKLKKAFPNVSITNEDENGNETKFPTVYISIMDSPTLGDDLEAVGTNGVLATFSVRITTNTDKDDLVEVLRIITDAFMDLKFRQVGTPLTTKYNGNHVANARFRRVIGASETIDFQK